MHNEKERIISMINQIAENNISAGDENAVAAIVAGHVKKFWPRRMKNMLKEYIDQGGQALHPAALLASKQLFAEN